MRNGNIKTKRISRVFLYPGSYPTYEEWKLLRARSCALGVGLSSYPTYEEWKLYI